MKFNIKAGLGVVAALLCSSLVLDLTKFDYNVFRDSFVLWKAAVKLGTPMLFVLIWFRILRLTSKAENK
jgi:hypothetical protein